MGSEKLRESMSQEKILISIRDNDLSDQLKDKYTSAGYSVIVAKLEFKSAINIIAQEKPDILLISVKLENNYSGIDIVSEIKKHFDLPVIYICSQFDPSAYKKARETKPKAFFTQPIEIDNIFSATEIGLANHKLQKQISDSNSKYMLAIKAGKTGVYEIDPETLGIDGDEALAEMFGYNLSEVKSLGWGALLPSEDFERKKKIIYDLLQKKIDSYTTEIRVIKKDGSLKHVVCSGSLINGGDKIKITGTLTDITDRKIAEEKLKEYSEQLRISNLAKDKFFSIISHDLRNPFNTLLGYSELLANNIEDLEKTEIINSAKTLHKTATNLFALLTNLLEWSKLQTSNFTIDKSEFSVSPVINHILNLYAESFSLKNIKVVRDTKCDANVYADQNMIETVIRNLISNAIKFTNDYGIIKISCQKNSHNIEIAISDNGIGISEEDQLRLFKIDKLLTTEGTRNEKGTGFGLLLSKELVEKNGGSIKLQSEKGRGSTFTISLPLSN